MISGIGRVYEKVCIYDSLNLKQKLGKVAILPLKASEYTLYMLFTLRTDKNKNVIYVMPNDKASGSRDKSVFCCRYYAF